MPSHTDETGLIIPALQVLHGYLPANAGPEYFGAAPSYLLAAWFQIAGSSPVANDAFAYGVSLLILWTTWLVLRRFVGNPAAVLGLAVLAVPPLLLLQWSFTTSGTHPALMVLGNLCLLATHTIFVADPGRPRAILGIGLLAGLGWWANPLIVVGADGDAEAVTAALRGQPVSVRQATAGPYPLLVLTPTAPPRHLDKKHWRAGASENSAIASRMVDGDRHTQWTSSSPGSPSLSVTLDLGAPREIGGLEVRPGLPGRTLRLAGSLDGTTWTAIDALTWAGSLYWTGSELLNNGGPKWAVSFPRTSFRHLRLSPATPFAEPWTLAEIDALE